MRILALILSIALCLVIATACKRSEVTPAQTAKLPEVLSPYINVKMIQISPGRFQMSSYSGEKLNVDKKSLHWVTISKPYLIGATEVTQGQWKVVMGINRSSKYCRASVVQFEPSKPEEDSDNLCDEYPVQMVSWDEAVEFCNRLSDLEGLTRCYAHAGNKIHWENNCTGYRLPTEAEWEYAARAGNPKPPKFGRPFMKCFKEGINSYDCDQLKAMTLDSDDSPFAVAEQRPNTWEIYDMIGNVMEWVWDWHEEFTTDSVIDPQGPTEGAGHLVCGHTGYDYGQISCRMKTKYMSFNPEVRHREIGFRIARSVPEIENSKEPMDQPTKLSEEKHAKRIFHQTQMLLDRCAAKSAKRALEYLIELYPNSLEAAKAQSQLKYLSAETKWPITEMVQKPHQLPELKLILIPAGYFLLKGDTRKKKYDERFVTIDSHFLISETAVTQRQWKAVMGCNPSFHDRCGDDCPVECISWYDAIEFCNRLSDVEGRTRCYSRSGDDIEWNKNCSGYRLPTEEEWAWAAFTEEQLAKCMESEISKESCLSSVPYPVDWKCSDSKNNEKDSGTSILHKSLNEFDIIIGKIDELVFDKGWKSNTGVTSRKVLRGDWFDRKEACSAIYNSDRDPSEKKSVTPVGFRIARSLP